MRLVIRFISAVAVILGVAWVISAPGYEPIITSIGGLIGLLSTLMPHSSPTPSPAQTEPEPEPPLSNDARELLAEIDACTQGDKGLTIMFAEPTQGDYRPYLNTSFYGPPGGARIIYIGSVIAAAAELEERGFLVPIAATEAMQQYKRTGRQA